MFTQKKVTLALIGAGQRAQDTYEAYAAKYPHEVQFVAVAEPQKERRERVKYTHNLAEDKCFIDWQDLLVQPKLADAILICTPDAMHFQPAIAALQAGYHILLEKPMSPSPDECLQMGDKANSSNCIFMLGYTLRYTNVFSMLKQLLNEKKIGKVISIQHSENVAYWHYAHAFVRGNWRNSTTSSPMLLTKSCHDMDLLLWLAGADCTQISSFGYLTHFTSANAPQGVPQRCLDGCPVRESCLYYAPNFYLTGETDWPASAISEDTSADGLLKALKEGPYGRCVYHCDNNVVDHQIVNIAFANQVTASFTMCAFSNQINRTIKILGTQGELKAISQEDKSEIELIEFASGGRHVISLPIGGGSQGYGGGDFGLMRHFIRLVQNNSQHNRSTSVARYVQSHLMAFAAEEARLESKVISIKEFERLHRARF